MNFTSRHETQANDKYWFCANTLVCNTGSAIYSCNLVFRVSFVMLIVIFKPFHSMPFLNLRLLYECLSLFFVNLRWKIAKSVKYATERSCN